MRHCIFLFLTLFLFISQIHAATTDTLHIYSPAMDRKIKVNVVVPKDVKPNSPTVYLLHGYSGNADTWLIIKPELKDYADQHQLIIVCPDGENSWYWDSPLNPRSQFETFISKELVEYIDFHYPTRPTKFARAIAGLSMGGHGAMWLSMRHPDVFGAAGSMSGGVDIRPFPDNWEMKKQIGEKSTYPALWEQHTAINQINRIKPGDVDMIICCGYDDFFFQVNCKFHEKLLAHGIQHEFLVNAGAHTPAYWAHVIDYEILFFIKYFQNHKQLAFSKGKN